MPESKRAERVQAGWAEVEFTPEPGLTLLGQMHERRGERKRDPLIVSAIALRSPEAAVVLASVDICLLSTAFVIQTQQRFSRAAGLPGSHLLLHATHTHVAPSTISLLAARAEPAFVARLQGCILQAAQRALADLQPADLFAGTGHLNQMGWNRRAMYEDGSSQMYGRADLPGYVGIEGPRDSALGVLFARSREGAVRGVIVNFSTHPNTLENESFYSADIPGEVRRVLKRLLGPDLVVVYLTGAAGNTAPMILDPPVQKQAWRDEEGLLRSGLYMAGETAKVMAQCIEPMTDPELRLEETTLEIPLRPWPEPSDRSYPDPLLKEVWPSARTYYQEARDVWPRRLLEESPVPVRLNVLRIGDAALCTNPAELFVEYGLEIREGSPARVTLVSELTDGYAGYVPTRLAFQRGGYETWPAPTSQLAPGAGEEIVNATKALLSKAFYSNS